MKVVCEGGRAVGWERIIFLSFHFFNGLEDGCAMFLSSARDCDDSKRLQAVCSREIS